MTNKMRFQDADRWVEIDLDLCTAVAACVDVCPVQCYDIVDGKVDAGNIGECIECLACESICPEEAILAHFAW